MQDQIEDIFNTLLQYEDPELEESKKKKLHGWFVQICVPET